MILKFCFFFNDTATTEIYTLSLHDALPIYPDEADDQRRDPQRVARELHDPEVQALGGQRHAERDAEQEHGERDRKSTRLNSSHANISYAVFCLKKKNILYLDLTDVYPTCCS